MFSTKLHLGLKVSFNCEQKLNAIPFQLITQKNKCASSLLDFYQCSTAPMRYNYEECAVAPPAPHVDGEMSDE